MQTKVKERVSETQPSTKKSITISLPSTINILPILMIGILVAAFFLGILWQKVQYLEKGSTLANGNSAGQAPPLQQTAGNQPPAPGQKVDVSVGHLPVKGKANAKVTIVAFEDFRCPFCKKSFDEVEPQIIKDYVDTGKVRFAYRHFQFLGPASVVAGNASECANEQNKFWDFHEYLYKNQPSESDTTMYTTDKMTEIAGKIGLNTTQFKSCLSSNKYQKNVDQDYQDGQKAGVSGTPTFYINGIQLVGAQPYAALKTVIDQELAK